MLEKNRISRVTVEQRDSKMVWETPYNDAPLEEMIQGFVGCLVGHTWDETLVWERMYALSGDILGKNSSEIVDIEPEPND